MNTQQRGLLIVVSILALVILVVPILGGGMMGPGMMGGYAIPAHANGWAWGLGAGLSWLVMLAFWGALIAGGIALARWATAHGEAPGRSSGADSAETLAILRRRYAAGEIDQSTYTRMKEEVGV